MKQSLSERRREIESFEEIKDFKIEIAVYLIFYFLFYK